MGWNSTTNQTNIYPDPNGALGNDLLYGLALAA